MRGDPVTTIVVRHRFEGFHRWPGATGKRQYLSARHRHLFHLEVEVATWHGDREIEFHDLLDTVKTPTNQTEWGSSSCEDIAFAIGAFVLTYYPGRAMTVSVFEDGECGARIRWPGKTTN